VKEKTCDIHRALNMPLAKCRGRDDITREREILARVRFRWFDVFRVRLVGQRVSVAVGRVGNGYPVSGSISGPSASTSAGHRHVMPG